MNDRRLGIEPHKYSADRWTDKLFSLIFWALVAFLLGMLFGCQTPNQGPRFQAPDCSEPPHLQDFRCQVYYPQAELELDNFEEFED